LKRYEEAYVHFKAAAQIEPKYTAAHNNMKTAEVEMRKAEKERKVDLQAGVHESYDLGSSALSQVDVALQGLLVDAEKR
jgi:hypothetical protein